MQKDKLLLRLPADLKAKLTQRADAEDISSNRLVIKAIEAYLGVPDHGDIREALTECYAQIAELCTRVAKLESQQMTPKWLLPIESRLGALEAQQQASFSPTEPPSFQEPEPDNPTKPVSVKKPVKVETPVNADDRAQLVPEQLDLPSKLTVEEPVVNEAPQVDEVIEAAASSEEECVLSPEDVSSMPTFQPKLITCSTPEIEVGSVVTIQDDHGDLLKNLQVREIVGGLALVRDEEGSIYYQRFRDKQDGDEELDYPLDEHILQGREIDFSRFLNLPQCQSEALKRAGYPRPKTARRELAKQGTTPEAWLLERGWVRISAQRYRFDENCVQINEAPAEHDNNGK